MNGHSNTARPLHQACAGAGIQSLRMAESARAIRGIAGMERTAGFTQGGDAQ